MQETGLVSGILRPSTSVPEHLTLRNILLATDFSEFSTRALSYALGLADRYKSRLYLFHCIDPTPYGLAPEEVQTARDDAQRDLDHLVSEYRRGYHATNVDIKVSVEAGTLPLVLAQVVDNLGLDLIVVGTHGRTGWRKLALGSVAEMVVGLASCPVLSVGPSSNRTRIQEFGPESILLAYEACNRSQRAESYALSLARKYGSRLTEVAVVEDRCGRVVANVSQFGWYELEKDHSRFELLPPDSLRRSTEIGSQSDLLLDLANQTCADLIVLAVPPNHRFTDRFRTTNAYRVVCEALCPVLTVRAGTEQGAEA